MVTESHSIIERVLKLGREGNSRPEIAAALGVSLAELAAREVAEPELSRALALAEEAARAWWAEVQRSALSEGARFGQGAWREAVSARFGSANGDRPVSANGNGRRGAGGFGGRSEVITIIDIPDNGRERGPDGRSPCDGGRLGWEFDLKNIDEEIAELTEAKDEADRQRAEIDQQLEIARERKAEIESIDPDDYE